MFADPITADNQFTIWLNPLASTGGLVYALYCSLRCMSTLVPYLFHQRRTHISSRDFLKPGVVASRASRDLGCYSPTEHKPGTAKAGRYSRPDFCGWSALEPISR